ncbi:MAG: hypothetical protein ACXVBI_01585, partial [Flavisolibacter sp.]
IIIKTKSFVIAIFGSGDPPVILDLINGLTKQQPSTFCNAVSISVTRIARNQLFLSVHQHKTGPLPHPGTWK